MKKSILLLAITVIVAVMPCDARSVSEMWLSMPDSLLPYLSSSQRTELTDLVSMGVKPEVQNKLHDKTSIDTLTASYMRVRLSDVSTLELKMLPAGSDSLLCMVTTVSGPEKESDIAFYDTSWQKTTVSITLPAVTARPDTMSVERYDSLQRLLEPQMTWCRLSPADNTLTVAPSAPLVNKSDRQKLNAIMKERTLAWDESLKTFK